MEMNHIIDIDGRKVASVEAFHREFAHALHITHFYGRNLHALWDILSAGIERPAVIRWRNAEFSKGQMKDDFDEIVRIFERAVEQDHELELDERLTFILD
jgi:ribonuclease inhibitor